MLTNQFLRKYKQLFTPAFWHVRKGKKMHSRKDGVCLNEHIPIRNIAPLNGLIL